MPLKDFILPPLPPINPSNFYRVKNKKEKKCLISLWEWRWHTSCEKLLFCCIPKLLFIDVEITRGIKCQSVSEYCPLVTVFCSKKKKSRLNDLWKHHFFMKSEQTGAEIYTKARLNVAELYKIISSSRNMGAKQRGFKLSISHFYF